MDDELLPDETEPQPPTPSDWSPLQFSVLTLFKLTTLAAVALGVGKFFASGHAVVGTVILALMIKFAWDAAALVRLSKAKH